MTKYIVALFAAFAFATSAYAAPASIVLPSPKMGDVTFNHARHSKAFECKKCHETAMGGKIAGFNKDKAHALCIGCHKATPAPTGPTMKCRDCHKKA